MQIGTCGSPIELDKADPSKVLARMSEPFVQPEPSEREGYVPNVVYTCGAMRHGDMIVLPYAVSDTFCHFATVRIAALLQAMTSCGPHPDARREEERFPVGQSILESERS